MIEFTRRELHEVRTRRGIDENDLAVLADLADESHRGAVRAPRGMRALAEDGEVRAIRVDHGYVRRVAYEHVEGDTLAVGR